MVEQTRSHHQSPLPNWAEATARGFVLGPPESDSPPRAVQATAFTDNTIKRSVSYWFPSTRHSGSD